MGIIGKKIGIIGTGLMGKTILTSLTSKDKLPTKPEDKPNNLEDIIPKKNHDYITILGEKEFICKGKHEYRKNESGQWTCQCGRKL